MHGTKYHWTGGQSHHALHRNLKLTCSSFAEVSLLTSAKASLIGIMVTLALVWVLLTETSFVIRFISRYLLNVGLIIQTWLLFTHIVSENKSNSKQPTPLIKQRVKPKRQCFVRHPNFRVHSFSWIRRCRYTQMHFHCFCVLTQLTPIIEMTRNIQFSLKSVRNLLDGHAPNI